LTNLFVKELTEVLEAVFLPGLVSVAAGLPLMMVWIVFLKVLLDVRRVA
jgi:hypothetical protein